MHGVPEYYQTFEAEMVHICAPTLAGLKAGSIFSLRSSDRQAVEEKIDHWGRILHPFGLSIRLLSVNEKANLMIIYVWRRRRMEEIFHSEPVRAFLEAQEFPVTSFDACLDELSRRLCQGQGFPHEIGVFLDYPLEDVIGFIKHEGRSCALCGMWKVYGDPHAAQKCFDRYNKCIRIYTRLYASGTAIEKLTVPCAA